MHRKTQSSTTNLENKQELKLTPITGQQLIEMRALEKEIKDLIKQINRPWSIALGAAAIPFLAQFLLLNKRSPFHSYYTEVHQSIYDKHAQSTQEEWRRIKEMRIDSLRENYEYIMRWIEDKRKFLPNGKNLSQKQILEKVSEEGPSLLIPIYEILIDLYLSTWTTIRPIADAIKADVLQRMPITELVTFVQETYKQIVLTDIPEVFKGTEKLYGNKQTALEIESNPWIIGFKIPFAILVQTQFCDRMIPWKFPHGVGQKPAPQLSKDLWLSELLAEEHIEKLARHRDELNIQAKHNRKMTRILLGLFLPVIIAVYGTELPPVLAIYFAISLASLALTNATQELQQYYAHRTLESTLKKQFNLLQTLEDEEGIVRIKQHTGETLEQSHFILHFKNQGFDLARGTLKNIIKHALIFNKIDILAEAREGFYLAANVVTDKAKLLRVKEIIKENIKRQSAIKALKEQITKLKGNKPDSISLYRPFHDADGFPTAEIHFNLLPHEKFLLEKLKEISQQKLSFYATEGEDGCLYVRMMGHEVFDDEPFKKVQAFQRRVYEALKQQFIETTIESEDSAKDKDSNKAEKEIRRAIAAAKAAAKAAAANSTSSSDPEQVSAPAPIPPPPPPTAPVRVITWSAGVFRSDDEKSQIHPMLINERVRTEASLHRAHHFTLFRLHRSNFPDTDQAAFEAAERIVNVPTIGNRNIVFAKGPKRKPNGEWIATSAKARMKGKTSDIGLYAREEKSPSGESLHIFEAVSIHRHVRGKS